MTVIGGGRCTGSCYLGFNLPLAYTGEQLVAHLLRSVPPSSEEQSTLPRVCEEHLIDHKQPLYGVLDYALSLLVLDLLVIRIVCVRNVDAYFTVCLHPPGAYLRQGKYMIQSEPLYGIE